VSGTRRALRLAGALATAAVLLLLAGLEAERLPAGTAQRASDVLQLGLACFASLCCLAAAARPGARAFWTAFGLGCAAWATGQGFWVVLGVPFQLEASYAEADLAFTASTALFVAAFVLRPDRRDNRRPLLVIDVLVVLVAMLLMPVLPHVVPTLLFGLMAGAFSDLLERRLGSGSSSSRPRGRTRPFAEWSSPASTSKSSSAIE
jgi:hypothetical protein